MGDPGWGPGRWVLEGGMNGRSWKEGPGWGVLEGVGGPRRGVLEGSSWKVVLKVAWKVARNIIWKVVGT